MNRDERNWATKEIGLEAGYRFLKFMLKTEHLHYGLFEADIPVDIANLKIAQDRFLQRLVEMIPAGTRTILDVGCGSGKMAEHLIEQGFNVDCVSPGHVLTEIAAERLGTRAKLYRGKFETVQIALRYDLVLFSESFSYIPVNIALAKSVSLLNPGGHLLISDFFHDGSRGRSPIGGGHDFASWRAAYKGAPIELIAERDLTAETAPLHDIAQRFTLEVARPLWESLSHAAEMRWPRWIRFGRWLFGNSIGKLERRRLSAERNGASFRHFKIYKTYLFKAREEVASRPQL